MLRWLLALVVVANLLFLAWSQHWLAPLGLAPLPTGEPERVQQQLRPEALTLRPDSGIKPTAAPREAESSASAASALPSAGAVSNPASASSAAP